MVSKKEAAGQFSHLSHISQQLLDRINYPLFLPVSFELLNVVETHISLVLIGAKYVLKFKKPVDLGFVDYATFEKRWSAAAAEVILNRRLSTEIYLGVLAVNARELTPDSLSIVQDPDPEKAIEADEVAVVMNTLAPDTLLSWKIEHGAMSREEHLEPLAERLYQFHKQQREQNSLLVEMNPTAVYGRISQAVRDNFRIIREAKNVNLGIELLKVLQLVEAYALNFLSTNKQKITKRASQGFIVDGHGDLRAEHISFFNEHIEVIDCLEFSAELRTVDVLNDLAFLAMDLDYQREDVAAVQFVESYIKRYPESWDAELFQFFKCYRAMVRAKVETLQSAALINGILQVAAGISDATRGYLALASRYAAQIKTPFLLVIGGLMGVGKSTLAAALRDRTAAEVINSDIIRTREFGVRPAEAENSFGGGKYSISATKRTYQLLIEEAEVLLKRGVPVVLDASFTRRWQRELAGELARRINCRFVFVWCELEEELTRKRLRTRLADPIRVSDGREELLSEQRTRCEYPEERIIGEKRVFNMANPRVEHVTELCAILHSTGAQNDLDYNNQ